MALWTFRRNENDVVNLYNTLSPVMQLATGGDMLNFGYWHKEDISPVNAQNRLCNKIGELAELESANSLLDIGSGLSAPAIIWTGLYPHVNISCLKINYIQLQLAKKIVEEKTLNSMINGINSTSTMLPFSTNSLDRIIALESAQHFKPFHDFISESYRVLKKNGILTFAMPVIKNTSSIKKLGVLALTWSSEHYKQDFVVSKTTKKFKIIKSFVIKVKFKSLLFFTREINIFLATILDDILLNFFSYHCGKNHTMIFVEILSIKTKNHNIFSRLNSIIINFL